MQTDAKRPKEWNWFDQPRNIKKLRIGFYAVLILLVLPDFLVHKHTLFSSVEGLPGFYALFGFLSCVAIIVISKVLGLVLKQREDYYDR